MDAMTTTSHRHAARCPSCGSFMPKTPGPEPHVCPSRPVHPHAWPPERTARLHELHAAGKTMHEIAMELGCTRNAVIGKLGRLYQAGPRPSRAKPKPIVPDAAPASPPASPPAVRPRFIRPMPAPAPEPARAVSGGPVTIAALTPWSCRWPLWSDTARVPFSEQFYCGERAIAKGRYCACHAARAYGHRGA
jgi:GcrA cell cycle regulator